MPRRLTVIDGADQGQMFLLPETGTLLIGNSRKHAEVCLHDLYVARVHCQVEVEGDQVTVSDRETTGGTLINGVKITQQQLHLGDVLRVGNSHLRLEEGDAPPPADPEEARSSAPKAPQDAAKLPPLPSDRLADLTGHILGHFEIGGVLAPGHYGVVFHAHDVKADQAVVLKVLPSLFPANTEEMRRFVAAMKPVLFLHHPSLVLLRGLGKTGPYVWIAQEPIEGDSLATVVKHLSAARKIKWRPALRVAIQMAQALEFISARHLVHGNITPANILLEGEDGPARLNDLGLWEGLGGSVLLQKRLEKKLLAELPYLSPEHLDPEAPVDELSDQYSLGAVLYALLTGRPPCEGATPEETMTGIRTVLPVKPRDYQRAIPDEFQAVVLRMLAKHPEERYPSPGSLLADLETIAAQRSKEA